MTDLITKQDDPRLMWLLALREGDDDTPENWTSEAPRILDIARSLELALAELITLKQRVAEDTRIVDWLQKHSTDGLNGHWEQSVILKHPPLVGTNLREAALDAMRKENPSDAPK